MKTYFAYSLSLLQLVLCLACTNAYARIDTEAEHEGLEMTLTEDEEGGWEERVASRTLIINGVIEDGDAERLDEILALQYQNATRTILLLTSSGGLLEEVPDLIQVITQRSNQFFKRYKRPLLFAVNEHCGSACTILTAGLTRHRNPQSLEVLIHQNSVFYFHLPQEKIGKNISAYTSSKELTAATERMLAAYLNNGASPEWIRSNFSKFKGSGLSLKAKDLCWQDVRVIPVDSCSKLSPNDFILRIENVYGENRTLASDRAIQQSILKKRGLSLFFF